MYRCFAPGLRRHTVTILKNISIMVGEGLGKNVAAGPVGDEIKIIGKCRPRRG